MALARKLLALTLSVRAFPTSSLLVSNCCCRPRPAADYYYFGSSRQLCSSSNMSNQDRYTRIVSESTRPDDDKKGTILMLHGWAQNAGLMRTKTKTLTKKLNQAGYDCIFLEAPLELPMTSLVEIEGEPVEVENGKRENARAWFLLSETDPADASLSQSGKPMKYIGLDQSLAVVEKELGLCRDEELVCVLGFSQGGVFVHILSRLAEIMPESFGRIQAAIVASGFAGQHCSDETDKYHVGRMPDRDKLSMPSLHIIGEKDTSVRPELSFDLVSIYDKSEVLLHEKGHIIPQQSAYCAKAIAFLDEIASDKVAKSQI